MKDVTGPAKLFSEAHLASLCLGLLKTQASGCITITLRGHFIKPGQYRKASAAHGFFLMSTSNPSNDPANCEPPNLITATRVLVAISMLGFLSLAGIVMGSFYWRAYLSTAPAKNWNGCAASASEADQAEWAAKANATGKPLCKPGFLEDE